MADNNFKGTVEALFTGIDGVVSSKTVVGECNPYRGHNHSSTGGCIFAIGAGAFNADKKEKRSRRCWRQDDTLRSSCDPEWTHKTGKY